MNQRLYLAKSNRLKYRHYLAHFKWPLLASICFVLVFYFTKTDRTSMLHVSLVLYPTDPSNASIRYYFSKKNDIKVRDDADAVKKKQKTIVPFERPRSASKSYLILEYTRVFGQPRFCSSTDAQIFGQSCPFTNCKYTCNQTREKDALVLLMHKQDLDREKLTSMPRNPNQIWLLWHDESNEELTDLNSLKFNWTVTYRISAEASIGAYGITIAKSKPWSYEQFHSWIDEQLRQRHDQAAWFVSNCRPQKRLERFRLLRQHYPIVALGACIPANESVSPNARRLVKSNCDRQSPCEETYLNQSKFYLAFESQSCTDYITEKFWRTLAFGAIPIVGGPARQNYLRIAPPNSFIHVDDYASEKELADYLILIGEDRSLYEKYHSWRRRYDVYHQAKDLDSYRFCELCYRLNTYRQRIWYENINDWFLDRC